MSPTRMTRCRCANNDGLVLLVMFLASPPVASWSAGEQCAQYDYSNENFAIGEALKGKHLQIHQISWPPYGIYDPTKSGNDAFSGFDIDLLKLVAAKLQFNYTLSLVSRLPNETWTDFIDRDVLNSDLILSYWLDTVERRMRTEMLTGEPPAAR